jgi:hypothetical protein
MRPFPIEADASAVDVASRSKVTPWSLRQETSMSRYRYLYLWSLAFVGFHDTQAHPSYAFVNGFWFNGRGFDKRTMYVVNDTLASRRPTTVDSVVDLRGAFVVPPYADAHNHNAEFFGEARARALVARYFAAGVFYDQNPATVERARDGMRGLANTPTGIDVRFAIGGITASGGHPTGLYLRNAKAGVFTPADSDGGFLWIVDSLPDLDR